MALLNQFGPQDEEMLKLMQAQAMQRQTQAPTSQAVPVYENPSVQPIPNAPPQAGFMDRVKSTFQDPEKLTQMGMILSSLGSNSAPLQKALGAQLGLMRERKSANKTVELLTKMGRPDLAKAVEQQPELAMDALKQVYGMGGASAKSYAPQLDPATGQYYITEYDPQTGEARRVNVGGAIGETPEAVAQREQKMKLEENDYMKAQQVGQETFARAGTIDGMIGRLNQAYGALLRGGKSGPFQQFLPVFDEATASLRQAANQLGIDIINSATFGALSEAELKLALQTGLPTQLDEEPLKKHIQRKVAAQVKLRDELVKQARMLASGQMRYSDFIKQYEPKGGTEVFLGGGGIQRPPSITEEEWNAMTQEQRNLFK